MTDWKALDEKLGVVWSLCGIAVMVIVGYGAVKSMQMHKKMAKRMHLEDDDE